MKNHQYITPGILPRVFTRSFFLAISPEISVGIPLHWLVQKLLHRVFPKFQPGCFSRIPSKITSGFSSYHFSKILFRNVCINSTTDLYIFSVISEAGISLKLLPQSCFQKFSKHCLRKPSRDWSTFFSIKKSETQTVIALDIYSEILQKFLHGLLQKLLHS